MTAAAIAANPEPNAKTSGSTPAQLRAADPVRSVWVTANAGTGKTRVLVDRVLRLLLADANPEGILCLTFTKAAAAEMLERVESRLEEWATAEDDKALEAELLQISGVKPSRSTLDNARTLFATVLDLPDGLGIQTIHGFCQSILRRFPLEAGIAPHFEVMDDRTAAEMLAASRIEVIEHARDGIPELVQYVAILASAITEESIAEALDQILADRFRILETVANHGGIGGLKKALSEALDIPDHLDPQRLVEDECRDGIFDVEGLVAAGNCLCQEGSASDQKMGRTLLTWLNAAPADRVITLPHYIELYATKTHSNKVRLVSKKLAEQNPATANTLMREQARIVRLVQSQLRLNTARRTIGLVHFAHDVIQHYEAAKERHAALDYDDLIEKTRRLLARRGAAEWVHYKLDARIDHVLVDEAQDTSPDQWAIIEALVDEFFVGQGAKQLRRTFFVVGDEKQSIYSFRGADLDNFRNVRARLVNKSEAAQAPIEREFLELSFRSTGVVLDLVDRVFENAQAQTGVVVEGETVHHTAARRNEPGKIELWPLVSAEDAPVTPSWPLPDRPQFHDEPERRLADGIAKTIHDWISDQRFLANHNRPIEPGDILILLARRGAMQEHIVRALKRHRVPVAGADRLALHEHLAVRDLIALGNAILLPDDDLNFAALLKSPLFNISEEELFELAWNRGDAIILDRLRDRAKSGHPLFADAWSKFERWRNMADFMPPFEFYAQVLGPHGGRRDLIARLGLDAIEPIEAFLVQTLTYEEGHPASLQGFLHWLSLESQTLKRDTEPKQNQVRILTVHGAKGLESPIVFLADTASAPPAQLPRLLWHQSTGLPLWRSPKAERGLMEQECAETLERRHTEERHRLLYVAMTRARDELYVCGIEPSSGREIKDDSWYQLIRTAFEDHEHVERFDPEFGSGFDDSGLRVVWHGDGAAAPADPRPPAGPPKRLPEALRRPPDLAKRKTVKRLVPSAEEADLTDNSGTFDPEAIAVGNLVHRLLESLPRKTAAERDEILANLARHIHRSLQPASIGDVQRSVNAVLNNPAFEFLFEGNAFTEQAIAGVINDVYITGQIDRLVVRDDEILIIDYKTNRSPPPDAASISTRYLRQMAAYVLLMTRIYPDHKVKCGFLWTTIPRLDFLEPDALIPYMPSSEQSEHESLLDLS